MAKDAKGHGSEGRSGGQKQSWDAKRGSYAKGFAGPTPDGGHGVSGSQIKQFMAARQAAVTAPDLGAPSDPAAHQTGVEAARNTPRESLRGSINSNPIDASGEGGEGQPTARNPHGIHIGYTKA
jgi:hypothetical protein